MIIPFEQLDKDTLYNLIESYVLREGTDYGEVEASIESLLRKCNHCLLKPILKLIQSVVLLNLQ